MGASVASIAAVVSAAPTAAADTARVVSDVQDGPVRKIGVYSPSMRTVVYNQVIRGGGGAPTLFLLNGKGGGGPVWRDSWIDKTSYVSFFAGKGVNVVSPIVGKQAYLTDWDHPDPGIGVNKWETYLARELPGATNAHLGANGRNAIAGLSASGGPALDIGGRGPFVAAASYSGCPNISHPVVLPAMAATIATGPAVPTNMYDSLAKWAAHDPAASPWRLRGKAVYIGSATGVPGSYDKMAFP